jgi:hypothetical protein
MGERGLLDETWFAELAELRRRAQHACTEMRETVADWRRIKSAWQELRIATVAIRAEAQQVRDQVRRSVLQSKMTRARDDPSF